MASVDGNDLFPVRTISFLGRDVPTLGQNEFGPCALLGVVNALLLRGTLKVSSDHGALTLQDVLARLADRLLESNQADNPDLRAALDGAVTRLPTLAEGLDVNVKFDGGFEFTSDLAIFDLLDVRLVHGWRVDGENDAATAEALGSRSYNECIQEVVQLRSNELEGAAKQRAELVSTFLERTQTQLTYAGLAEIHSTLRENEVGVLYRNLHFATVFKREGVLYALVTDIGCRRPASFFTSYAPSPRASRRCMPSRDPPRRPPAEEHHLGAPRRRRRRHGLLRRHVQTRGADVERGPRPLVGAAARARRRGRARAGGGAAADGGRDGGDAGQRARRDRVRCRLPGRARAVGRRRPARGRRRRRGPRPATPARGGGR